MTKLRSAGVAAVFLAGCAVGGGASSFVVPKASAQQAALTRWEYYCKQPEPSATEMANKLGAEGWEMVAIRSRSSMIGSTYDIYCFKRPKI